MVRLTIAVFQKSGDYSLMHSNLHGKKYHKVDFPWSTAVIRKGYKGEWVISGGEPFSSSYDVMKQWCTDVLGGAGRKCNWRMNYTKPEFYIRNEASLIMFKLAWGDKLFDLDSALHTKGDAR